MSSCKAALVGDRQSQDIGHPSACRYWIVSPDNHNRLASIGCAAAAFVDPPTWTKAFASLDMSQRFYKTGDLVVQLAERSFIYVGRKDTQVKLRGFRMELGEVEYHLSQQSEPGRQFVVDIIQLTDQEPSLTVFFTVPGPCDGAILLKRALDDIVPAYIVPEIFIRLSKLPTTPSGKTDRKALRGLAESLTCAELMAYRVQDQQGAYRNADFSPPTLGRHIAQSAGKSMTDEERLLQRAWAEVLSIPPESIGVTDNFFTLGGNSIRAMRLVAAVRKLGRMLSVMDVFHSASLYDMTAKLSASIDAQPNVAVESSTKLGRSSFQRLKELGRRHAHLESENIESIAHLTDVQAWMLSVGKVDGNGFHDAVILDIPDGLNLAKLQKACAEVIRHLPILRSVFVPDGAAFLQVVLRNPPLDSASDNISQAGRFWEQLLHGSSVTPLAPLVSSPVSASPANTSHHVSVPLRNLQTRWGTESTALRAAWSLVLAQASGDHDIVFGCISANRNSTLPAMDQVAGPCINLVPARARIERTMTLASLVIQLQEQSNASIPHQQLGFRSIIKNCTSWRTGCRFSSIVVFQNQAALNASIQIGNTKATLSGHGSVGDSADIYIEARPISGQPDIKLEFASRRIPTKQATWIARCLTELLETLPSRLERSIGRISDDLLQSVGPYVMPAEPASISLRGGGAAAAAPDEQAQAMVSQAWKELDLLQDCRSQHANMFDCRADLVDAMLLAEQYRWMGYSVSTQDIVEHPSRHTQASLLRSLLKV
ncbi:hypothetical protein LTR37_014407 [Vermiconidia calcicola]|uniref:Uncharacterized protein n=1 Tax=Vermiconidia calcicola TaxID=1690605 RepID=A0ACC3MTY7_9PEZI|nr:hypothetical protein LTR37_014407 [Vermiconidia calcicola]